MANLSGIKDAEYLAQFLGKKIAIKSLTPNKYYLYPILAEIHADGSVRVKDSDGEVFIYKWEQCENPYILILEDVDVEKK